MWPTYGCLHSSQSTRKRLVPVLRTGTEGYLLRTVNVCCLSGRPQLFANPSLVVIDCSPCHRAVLTPYVVSQPHMRDTAWDFLPSAGIYNVMQTLCDCIYSSLKLAFGMPILSQPCCVLSFGLILSLYLSRVRFFWSSLCFRIAACALSLAMDAATRATPSSLLRTASASCSLVLR